MRLLEYGIVIPAYNAGSSFKDLLATLLINNKSNRILVIDSSSSDSTAAIAKEHNVNVISISKHEFNHGGTRNKGVAFFENSVDIVFFLTQDVRLNEISNGVSDLLSLFSDSSVSAVYGRQLPHIDANPIAAHARLFNYRDRSYIREYIDRHEHGIKSAFISNSYSAYRISAFNEVGRFPENTILAEDMFVATKLLLSGYKVAYCAEAAVRHSHNYTPWEEFRRYFDIGVFHACEPWIQEKLGGTSGEGLRFVKSELRYLWKHSPLWIPRALLNTACKLIGYRLGMNYKNLPKAWRQKLSMHKSYWLQQGK